MIIKREYVTFRRLVEGGDPGGKMFMDLLEKQVDKSRLEEVYNDFADLCLYEREIDWGLSGIWEIIEGFGKLDNEIPYDNGFTLEDVLEGEVRYADEKSVTMLLINKSWGVKSVVKVVEITED